MCVCSCTGCEGNSEIVGYKKAFWAAFLCLACESVGGFSSALVIEPWGDRLLFCCLNTKWYTHTQTHTHTRTRFSSDIPDQSDKMDRDKLSLQTPNPVFRYLWPEDSAVYEPLRLTSWFSLCPRFLQVSLEAASMKTSHTE